MITPVFLKWSGGKKRQLPYLLPLMSKASCYVEPFLGSGIVFANVPYLNCWLADHNPDLIDVYQCLRKRPEKFISDCYKYFNEQTNQADYYYEQRVRFNQLPSGWQRSCLFVYLNRHGYNGLCRYNRHGHWNVPFGSYKKVILSQHAMLSFAKRLGVAKLACQDFNRFLNRDFPAPAVIYLDPPYVPCSHTARFTHYYGGSFGVTQQEQLATLAQDLADQGHLVILSNHDLAYTRALYDQAVITSFKIARTLSCLAGKRLGVPELIAVFKKKKSLIK